MARGKQAATRTAGEPAGSGGLTKSEGEHCVRLARKTIEHFLATGETLEPESEQGVLGEARGVFVTLEEYPSRELRGCIGYPRPIKRLAAAVRDNAIHAASEDPRFPPLTAPELSKIVIEVSVLSIPQTIKARDCDDLAKQVKVGCHGLIVKYGYNSGLLLPQVPIEWNWNAKEFLQHTCEKAGLPPSMWNSPNLEWQCFTAQIFSEQTPGGKIVEKKLVR